MRKSLAIGVAIVVGAAMGSPAKATVVFQQIPDFQLPGHSGSQSQWTSSTLNSLGSSPGYISADDFNLGSASTINEITWWGSPRVGGDTFVFTFYGDHNGIPGTAIATSTSGPVQATVIPGLGQATDSFDAILTTPFNASANTPYYLSIFDSGSNAIWRWESGSTGSGFQMAQSPGLIWNNTGDNFAFTLSAATPEPTAALLTVGAASVLIMRPRKSASRASQ